MAGDTQFLISKDQEHQLLNYMTSAQSLLTNQFSVRSVLEYIDREYQRENNFTKEQQAARLANWSGQANKLQDPTVPIVMPQVESALAYYVSVFLTGYPIFGVSSTPDQADAALQMETIIAENSVYARWGRQLAMFFRDGLKYNLHGIELDWQQKASFSIENQASSPNGAKAKKVLWAGNVIRRMDLYNTFYDPRVHPAEIHEKGEFAGYVEILSRVQMKQWMNDLFPEVSKDIVIRALESSPGTAAANNASPFGYYQPIINPMPIMSRSNLVGFDWLAWANNAIPGAQGIKYGNVYLRTKLYARLIPADFGFKVPEANTPQVWKFNIINNSVIVTAERQTNVHNYIPIFFGQPIEDGLDYQTKSFAVDVCDMQDTATAMVSGFMASKRKLVGDRVIYDPLRISEKMINSTNPAAKIPMRPSGYGKNPAESVYAFPYRDEQTQTLLQGAQVINSWADKINGQNPAQQGQFVKGNKTQQEFSDTMGHSNDRNHMMALMTELQVFTPFKEAVKLNILQYQTAKDVQHPQTGKQVKVDPVTLRQAAIQFKVSDGELPKDKLMSGETLQAALSAIVQSPQIGAGYNVPPLFSYIMLTQASLDLKQFEKSPLQIQFEQAQQSWEQVATQAIKAGQPPPAQPQMPPELVQELQAKQQSGGVLPPSSTSAALASTQGQAPAASQGASNGQGSP